MDEAVTCPGCRDRDARIAVLEERVADLDGLVRDLLGRIKDLEARLADKPPPPRPPGFRPVGAGAGRPG
ncbi:MAG TPA: hypothetical protein VM597_35275, partial [Gemmataceae bacterium]|nr:hypothetical protein [Gemmataceae bacterium]